MKYIFIIILLLAIPSYAGGNPDATFFMTPESAVELIKTSYITDKKGEKQDISSISSNVLKERNIKLYTDNGKTKFFTFSYSNGEFISLFPKFVYSDRSFKEILKKKPFQIALPNPLNLENKNPTIDHFDEYASAKDKADLLEFLFGKIMDVIYYENNGDPFVKLSTDDYEGKQARVYLLDKSGHTVPTYTILKLALEDAVEDLNFFQKGLLKIVSSGKNSRLNTFVVKISRNKINTYK